MNTISSRLAYVCVLLLSFCAGVSAQQPANFGRWNFLGCFFEPTGQRILNDTFTLLPQTTPQFCSTYCASQGATVSGIEVGDQCFCGSSLTHRVKVNPAQCNYTCPGDSSQTCGGYGFLQAFQLNSIATDVPTPSAANEGLATRTTIVLNFGPTPFEGTEVYTTMTTATASTTTPSGSPSDVNTVPPLSYGPGSATVPHISQIQTSGTPRLRDRSAQIVFGKTMS